MTGDWIAKGARRLVAVVCCCLFLSPMMRVQATDAVEFEAIYGEVYRNAETGYRIVIEDDANLLNRGELLTLIEDMTPITAYGNVAFKSLAENPLNNTGRYTENYYRQIFSKESGILFLIDMAQRNIWIYCDGAVYRTIPSSYADSITDNVYMYASKGDYYLCASKAYEQALRLLEGQKIARPMKYICNALLALVLALMANFGLVRLTSRAAKTSNKKMLESTQHYYYNSPPQARFDREVKTYNPRSSSGGGGGGRGGGGGHSGGGGGHGF